MKQALRRLMAAAVIMVAMVGVTPGAAHAAPSSLPFDFWFEVSWGKHSREFKTTAGRVCMDIKVSELRDDDNSEPGLNYLPAQLVNAGTGAQVGSTINLSYDNEARSYCWRDVSNSPTYQVWFGFRSQGGGLWVRGDGTMRT